MGLRLHILSLHFSSSITTTGTLKSRDCNALCTRVYPPGSTKSKETGSRVVKVSSSLAETAVSIAVAATVVGAATTILIRRTKASEAIEAPPRICEDCGGSGVCAECRGEGFVLRKMSDENAERARLMAKNAATRYTAGYVSNPLVPSFICTKLSYMNSYQAFDRLPKKWSYCMKCNAARSCSSCGGAGKLN